MDKTIFPPLKRKYKEQKWDLQIDVKAGVNISNNEHRKLIQKIINKISNDNISLIIENAYDYIEESPMHKDVGFQRERYLMTIKLKQAASGDEFNMIVKKIEAFSDEKYLIQVKDIKSD